MLSNPFFSGLDPKMVDSLAERSEMRLFAPGDIILHEGATGDAGYVIHAGRIAVSVNVQNNPVEVAEHGVGAFVGEIALLCEVPHTATVAAKTHVRALRISRDDFWSVMAADSQVLLSIVRILARRLNGTTVSLAYLTHCASALFDDRVDPDILGDIKSRQDEIGRFASLFESLATYVAERTGRLEDAVEERTRHLNREISRRKELEGELRRAANTDPLTGANNRRYFLDLCHREQERARRYGRSTALFMLDVDRFKRINDSHGHAVGDQVLKQLVAGCMEKLRTQDILGRLGGEEFAVLLPECTTAAALQVAERLRQALAEVEIPIPDGRLRFTVSIGVVDWPLDVPLEVALEQADQALYTAKSSGRNRVISGSEKTPLARSSPR
jgi:diguanylate cyclase (GGDEF)-like protein